MLSRALPRTAAAIDARMGRLHVGAQLHVSLRGEVVADAAVGLARPDVPLSPATLMPWMSCSKLAASVAFAIVWEVAFADPEVGLAVALVFNGMPADHAIHSGRQNEVCAAIYEDLGLAR
jgi:hypothetical protein